MGKGPTIANMSFIGPGGNAKMGGISLQGAHAATVRRVNVSGFSIGINADNSTFVTIEDTNVNLR
jgi:hypothetical protein